MQDFSKIARKITFVLFLAQSLASAGFIAVATISSILGARLGGSPAWAGVPSACYLLGSALAASAWGYVMEKYGRRIGITIGLFTGATGAFLAIISTNAGNLLGFLAGMLLMGMANAAVVLGRFAAAEVNPPERRGKALASVVLGGTFGSVFGPLIVGPAGLLAKSYGMDELSGAFVITLGLFVLAMIIVAIALRPDPRVVGRELAKLYPESGGLDTARSAWEILRQPKAFTALMAMILGQVVMVAVMVITSLHMKNHNHMLSDISTVISAHTFGMYAFSVVSGWLADKWGRAQVILVGALVLVLSCLTAPISPDVLPLSVSLFLLGLGWNFCFVGGSTLLADQLSPAERARTQGINDLLVGFASASASLSSGIVFASLGYTLVAVISAMLAGIPIFFSIRMLREQNSKPRAQTPSEA
jgi:MFS family permease